MPLRMWWKKHPTAIYVGDDYDPQTDDINIAVVALDSHLLLSTPGDSSGVQSSMLSKYTVLLCLYANTKPR